MEPLLRVSRQGCVTPLLEGLLLMISAVWRNCLICSLVSGASSAACAANGTIAQARTTKRNLAQGLGNSCMGALRELTRTVLPGRAKRQHQSLRRARKYRFAADSSLHFSMAALFSPRVFLPLISGRGPAVNPTWRMQ